MRNVAIVLFENVEVLDFAGPFEVFAVSRDTEGQQLFKVYTVAEKDEIISARNGLLVQPTYTLDTCPAPDLILVPGGRGSRTAMYSEPLLHWLNQHMPQVEQMLSVCTGALVLGRAGLLRGLAATTYHTAFEELRAAAPDTEQRPGERWVDNGKVVTSAGVSAGIDMSLHVVSKLHGAEQARRTADHMEYEYWR